MVRFTDSLKNIFKIKELRDRIFITLAIIVVVRIGTHIVLPGVDRDRVEAYQKSLEGTGGSLWEYMQVFTGGALANMALFALGIMPYITASIIMQLLTKTSKRLEAIAKEGPAGQRKISQYTRLLTIPVCILQAFMAIKVMSGSGLIIEGSGFGTSVTMTFGLAAGGVFCMWLGELITQHGIGNGASILIMAGIVDRMPTTFKTLFREARKGTFPTENIIIVFVLYIATIVAVIFITQAQRRIPVQHARQWRGQRVSVGQRNYLPMRVNQAGVMPVIFASALMVIPAMLGNIPGLESFANSFYRGQFLYVAINVIMIYFFSYFWTYLFFQPVEMANNLKEYGSFIPGIRPGQKTAEYLYEIINKITICGATFLCLIAILPDMVTTALPNMQRYMVGFLGGTGILIVVGVGLDVIQKIESYLLMHHYEGFVEGGVIRGRR